MYGILFRQDIIINKFEAQEEYFNCFLDNFNSLWSEFVHFVTKKAYKLLIFLKYWQYFFNLGVI